MARLGRKSMLIAVAATLAVVAAAATPQLFGTKVGEAFEGMSQADPAWLWLAALGFLCSLAGSAGGWCAAIRMCGARLGYGDANARYGVGSLVNTFLPARLGDAVRFGLFSRSLDSEHRLWTTGGAFVAIGAARAVALTALVVAGALAGALPLWPVAVLGGIVAVALLVAWRSRGLRTRSRVAHVLDAFRALGREPRAGLKILAWILLATLGRIAAAAAVAASLGVHAPLIAAIIIVPALDVATLLPLTPGNFGVTSGAIALALQTHGISSTHGLAVGLAFHGVETAVSLLYGICGLLVVAGATRPRFAWAAGVTASLALLAGIGATVLPPLL